MAAEGHAVMLACRILAVSESGFYAQRHRPPSARAIRHAALTELIGRVHLDSRGTYGARRVHAELDARSWPLGRSLCGGAADAPRWDRWRVRASALSAHP